MSKLALIDSNILIYAHDADSPLFDASQDFIKKQVASSTICLSLQVFTESYRIWTQKLNKPITPKQAWSIGKYYRKIGVAFIAPSLRAFDILHNITTQHHVKGVHVFDALLVATMIEHEVELLYTANIKDFKQYKEIKAVNPLE